MDGESENDLLARVSSIEAMVFALGEVVAKTRGAELQESFAKYRLALEAADLQRSGSETQLDRLLYRLDMLEYVMGWKPSPAT